MACCEIEIADGFPHFYMERRRPVIVEQRNPNNIIVGRRILLQLDPNPRSLADFQRPFLVTTSFMTKEDGEGTQTTILCDEESNDDDDSLLSSSRPSDIREETDEDKDVNDDDETLLLTQQQTQTAHIAPTTTNREEYPSPSFQEQLDQFLDRPFFNPDDYNDSDDDNALLAKFARLVKTDYELAEMLYVGILFVILIVGTQEALRMQLHGDSYVPFAGGMVRDGRLF
jgi:hypothetical protein